jgi:hypothetical protein
VRLAWKVVTLTRLSHRKYFVSVGRVLRMSWASPSNGTLTNLNPLTGPMGSVPEAVLGQWRAQAPPGSDHPREAAKSSANLSPTSATEVGAE